MKNGNLGFTRIYYLAIQYIESKKTRDGSCIETPQLKDDKKGMINTKNNNNDMCIFGVYWLVNIMIQSNTIKNKKHQLIRIFLLK